MATLLVLAITNAVVLVGVDFENGLKNKLVGKIDPDQGGQATPLDTM